MSQLVPPVMLKLPVSFPPVVWASFPSIFPKCPYPTEAGSVDLGSSLPSWFWSSLSQHLGHLVHKVGSLWGCPLPCADSPGGGSPSTLSSRLGLDYSQDTALVAFGLLTSFPNVPRIALIWGVEFCFPGVLILWYILDVSGTIQFFPGPFANCHWESSGVTL